MSDYVREFGLNIHLWDNRLLVAGDVLLEKARALDGQFPSLEISASVAFMAGASLERFTRERLTFLYNFWEQKGDPKSVVIANLMEQSIRTRMVELPRVVSKNQVQLNDSSADVKALHRLIGVRNRLAHVPEQVVTGQVVLDGESNISHGFKLDRVEDGMATFKGRVPVSPWQEVSVEAATNYLAVVRAYVDQCMNYSPENPIPSLFRRVG